MMATTVKKFIGKCDKVVEADPEYKKGKSDLEQCDCIGMIKYGLRENGVKFSTTGSNYTRRFQVTNAREIKSASSMKKGDVVFKYRTPDDPYYDLPQKYREGGESYTGDLRDYYHIGAVKSVDPLKIIHMTSPTATTDTKIGKWKVCAELKSEYISDYGASEPADETPEPSESGVSDTPSTDPEPVPEQPEYEMPATVWSENGKPVKLRAKPSTDCRLYDKLAVGTEVTVLKDEGDWCRVNYKHRKGWYMMTKFLVFG